MTSLRARLVASLLAISAAGLLLLGGITYFEQRSFLYDRVDGQARQATRAVAGALAEKGIGPAFSRRPPDRGPGGAPDRDGGGPQAGLPPGTYGQRRDASGKVLGSVVLSYDQDTSVQPALPRQLELGRLITVGSRTSGGDDGTHYRVLASADPSGSGSTVVAVPLRDVDQNLRRLLVVEALVISGILLLLLLVSRAVVRVGLLPLDRMGHTAGAIAAGDLSHRVEETDRRTEVGRLGVALNAMLDRLDRAFSEKEASEDRLRRFLADASHELRTPLASIRGYAELFRMGATSDPGETARAMQRIEDEATRMGVLVEDLLTLARLDEMPDAPHVDLDLAQIAADAVDDARATAPDRVIEADLPGGPVMVSGDAHQLRQVLANLLRNALTHTPPGTPIDVSLAPDGKDVRLAVRDHGPGLPADDGSALFERFWRSEGGRERGKGGAGLGLAIVAAIMDAHHGRVSATNAPGGGARFEVVLPASSQRPLGALPQR